MAKQSGKMAKRKPRSIACRDERMFIFPPERTALLVIDMQRDFFGDEDDPMWAVVPQVQELVGLCRNAGCRIVFTRESYAQDLSDVHDYRRSLEYVGREGPNGLFLVRGEAGHDFLDEFQPQPRDLVIDKPGFSAFHGSDLHEQLQALEIDHLILCGVTTQCCVHSTLRQAVDLGYWCLTVADCCAAEDPTLHEAALLLIAGEGHLFGWTCELSDVQRACVGKRRSK